MSIYDTFRSIYPLIKHNADTNDIFLRNVTATQDFDNAVNFFAINLLYPKITVTTVAVKYRF
jgi:hypothetical protein